MISASITRAQSDSGERLESRVDRSSERELTIIATHRIRDDDPNALAIAEELRPYVFGTRHDDQVVDRSPHDTAA